MTLFHDSFTLARTLAAPPVRAFAAWADPAQKRQWFVDSDSPDWTTRDYQLDFRVGGTESGSFELSQGPGAGLHENRTTYLSIEESAHIVMAYTMAMNGHIHSASLATVTFAPKGRGTLLTYTEQMTLFGATDGASGRQHGWTALLDALSHHLESTHA